MGKNVDFTAPLGFLILHELRKPGSGQELSERIGKRRKGILTPGTIYPALKQLHRKRLISYRTEGREKVYCLTKKGTEELDQLYKEFSTLFRGLRHKIRPMYKSKKK